MAKELEYDGALRIYAQEGGFAAPGVEFISAKEAVGDVGVGYFHQMDPEGQNNNLTTKLWAMIDHEMKGEGVIVKRARIRIELEVEDDG